MAFLRYSLTRVSNNTPFEVNEAGDGYVSLNYPTLIRRNKLNPMLIVNDTLDVDRALKIERFFEGDKETCEKLRDEFMNPNSVLNERVKYWEANNIAYTFEVTDIMVWD